MAKEFSRTQRVADQVQRELAQIIQLEMKDPRLGLVTVSAVNVSRDLAFADVYVSFLGIDEQQTPVAKEEHFDSFQSENNGESKCISQKRIDESVDVLNHASGFLRSQLARAIKLRMTPQLRFYYDNSLRRGQYLSSLIDQAVEQDRGHGGE